MSQLKGDKARHNKLRRRKIARRAQMRALRTAAAAAKPETSQEPQESAE